MVKGINTINYHYCYSYHFTVIDVLLDQIVFILCIYSSLIYDKLYYVSSVRTNAFNFIYLSLEVYEGIHLVIFTIFLNF